MHLERRFLATLFLWPREVALDAFHFVSPAHSAFFFALQQARAALWTESGWQALRDALEGSDELHLLQGHGGLDSFVNEHLQLEWATEDAFDTLLEQVRACPRCGR